MKILKIIGLVVFLVGLVVLCVVYQRVTSQVAENLIRPRNLGRSYEDPPDEVTRAFRVSVDDGVELDVWYTEAWGEPPPDPVDLMIILHGIGDNKRTMWPLARRYAVHGVSSVLVDLRGHGRSSSVPITYGAKDRFDLIAVLDHLEAEGMQLDDVGVYGPSYGGAVALQLGCQDPRVTRVVSAGGFGSMRRLMRPYLRSASEHFAWLVPTDFVQRTVELAGARGGFDPDDASATACIADSPSAHYVLVHSPVDEVVEYSDVLDVMAACGDRCELLTLEGMTHHETLSNEPLRQRLHEFTAGEPLSSL